jgi:3-deoxy-D-manno-octulosonate 8-phosphate phosphatase (KDO 8-P phosphatase)
MHLAGLAVAVANAHPRVAQRAHWRTHLGGGMGAVREACDLILHAQGKSAAEQEHWR